VPQWLSDRVFRLHCIGRGVGSPAMIMFFYVLKSFFFKVFCKLGVSVSFRLKVSFRVRVTVNFTVRLRDN